MIPPKIYLNSFSDKRDALTEIAMIDFWPFTLAVGKLEAEAAHHHPCDTWHYVLEGTVVLHSPSLAKPALLRGGDKVLIPRGCKHAIEVPDFAVLINALADPSMGMGPPKVH